MKLLRFEERSVLQGQSVLRAWQPGVLPAMLEMGLTLGQAQRAAKLQGKLLAVRRDKNLIVTAGKGLVGDVLIDDESVGLTYHAIGTDNTTPTVTDTQLGSEQNRKQITDRSRSGDQITLAVFYLASESTYSIAEAGIFGGSAASGTVNSGTLFSHYLQTYDNSGGGVDLTFDYVLDIG